jgi:hypothetical protein
MVKKKNSGFEHIVEKGAHLLLFMVKKKNSGFEHIVEKGAYLLLFMVKKKNSGFEHIVEKGAHQEVDSWQKCIICGDFGSDIFEV